MEESRAWMGAHCPLSICEDKMVLITHGSNRERIRRARREIIELVDMLMTSHVVLLHVQAEAVVRTAELGISCLVTDARNRELAHSHSSRCSSKHSKILTRGGVFTWSVHSEHGAIGSQIINAFALRPTEAATTTEPVIAFIGITVFVVPVTAAVVVNSDWASSVMRTQVLIEVVAS